MTEEGTELTSGVKWGFVWGFFFQFFHLYLSKVHLLFNKASRSLELGSIEEHLMSLYHQQTFVELSSVMLGLSGFKLWFRPV